MPDVYEPVLLPFQAPNVLRKRQHYLTLYRTGEELAARICHFLLPAVQPGHTGVVVATAAHVQLVRAVAAQHGLDVKAAEERGQLYFFDARAFMTAIMVNGMPNEALFHEHVTQRLERLVQRHPRLHIYGEIVAVMIEEGHLRAAKELEYLWNELGRQRVFNLLCGYPEGSLGEHHRSVCLAHTHMVTVAGVVPV